MPEGQLTAGWMTHIFCVAITLVSCSFSFHLPGPICSFTGSCLTAHPSFCFVPYSGLVLMYFLWALQLCSLTGGDNLSYRAGNSNNRKNYQVHCKVNTVMWHFSMMSFFYYFFSQSSGMASFSCK